MAAVVTGAVTQYLLVGQRVGINVLIAISVFLALGWRLARPAQVRLRDAWCAAGALSFAGACAVRADGPLVAFDVLAALGLSLAATATFRGIGVTDLAIVRLMRVALLFAWSVAAGGLAAVSEALPAARLALPSRSSPAMRYAAGGFLAAPLLIVFAALFASADAVFARLVDDALDTARLRELLTELPVRATVLFVVAWCAAGAFVFTRGDVAGSDDGGAKGIAGVEMATGAVVVIDALFLLFVGLQLAYLFGGRDTLDAAGITYSAYARRGFFELVAVATLVVGGLFVLGLVTYGRSRAYVAAASTLVLLALVVLVSAASRMDLYQQAYGWTELRFYAGAAIAYLAIALVIVAWAVWRSRMAFALQQLVIAAVAVALVANGVGPAAFVAAADLRRAIDPASLPADASRELDVGYLAQLGDGAVPAMVDALPRLPGPERAEVERALARLAQWRGPDGDWRSWNLDHERARELLAR